MNIIDDKDLAIRFKSNSVPPGERFLYLLLSIILACFTSYPNTIFPLHNYSSINNLDNLVFLSYLVIPVIGTIVCYQSNAAGDNKEFIERYICIGFPTAIRIMLIAIPLIIVAYVVIYSVIPDGNPKATSGYDLLFHVVFLIFFYWRLNSLIKIAAH
jgi:hypothetical protein